jgi:prophage tail gpP-like protein
VSFVEEIVTLVVDGHELCGWQSVTVARSMQDAAITFSLTATNPSWGPEAKALRKGKEIEIRTTPGSGGLRPGGGDLLCKGYVDHYGARYGSGSNKVVSLSGRSKAADAIDCPPVKHKTGRVEKKTLDQVAKELDEFGIEWRTDQKLDPIPKVQRRPDEPLFATIEREARRLGLMLAGQTDGSVLITRAGTKRHAGALVLGSSPVQEMSVDINLSSKRSPVVVRGQRAGGIGKESLRQEVQEKDASVERHRPIIIILEGDAPEKELKKRAKWERLRSSGFGTNVSAELSTWRDDGGQLWDAGRLVAIVAEPEDIDQDLTLSSVSFKQTIETGTIASLALVDPRAHGGKKPSGGGGSDQAYDPGEGLDD